MTQFIISETLKLATNSWIQNVAEPRRIGRIGKVLELGDPCFHAAIAAIWNAIAVLERLCRNRNRNRDRNRILNPWQQYHIKQDN